MNDYVCTSHVLSLPVLLVIKVVVNITGLHQCLQCFDAVGRKGVRPVKTERWGAGVVICLEQGADLHMAQLMTLPLTVSCFSKIQIGFIFLVPAHPGSPGPLNGCECVCLHIEQMNISIHDAQSQLQQTVSPPTDHFQK